MSCSSYLSDRTQKLFTTFFDYIARKIEQKPWLSILCGVLLVAICGSGILTLKQVDTSDRINIWGNSAALPYKQYYDIINTFDEYPDRILTLLISTTNNNDSILTPTNLQTIYDINDKINVINYNNMTYNDLCTKETESNCTSEEQNIFYFFEYKNYNKSSLNNTNIIYEVINDEIFYDSMELFLGGIKYNNHKDEIISAKTLRIIYSLKGTSNNKINLEFEKVFEQYWQQHQYDKNYNNLYINYFTSRSIGDEMDNVVQKDVPIFIASFIIITIYLIFSLSKLSCFGIRIYLVLSVIFVLICSILMGFGLCAYFGFEFHSTILLISFVLIGVGVDDMIILIDSYKNNNYNLSKCLIHSGLSITLTSLSSTIAFFMGSIIDIKGIKLFCLYSAFCFLSMYILQFLIFVPCMVYDQKRIKQKQNFCCPCLCKHVNDVNDNNDDVEDDSISDKEDIEHAPKSISIQMKNIFIKNAQLLFSQRINRIIIIIFFILAFILSILCSIFYISTSSDFSSLLPDNSFALDYINTYSNQFNDQFIAKLNIVIKNEDFSDLNTVSNILQLINEISINENTIGSVDDWLQDFLEWKWKHNNNTNDNQEEFYHELQTYLLSGNGSKWTDDIIFDDIDNIKYITRTKFTFNAFTANNYYEMYPQYVEYNNIMNKYVHNGYIITRDFIPSYLTHQITEITIQNCLITAVSIFVILILFLDIKIAIYILVIIIFINFDLFGWMYLTSVSLDSISYFQIVMSIGLTVDYVIHITHSICYAQHIQQDIEKIDNKVLNKINYNKRIVIAFNDIGISVIKGAFTTLLGVMCLSFSQSEAFRVFFKMFIGIIIIGLLHGIILTPAILGELTFIYENNNNNNKTDSEDEQYNNDIQSIAYLKRNNDASIIEEREYIDLHKDVNLMRSRYVRLIIFIIFIILICLEIFGLNNGNINIYHTIAYCMIITDGLWIITLVTIISTSYHLHLIFTEIGRMKDIPFMYISIGIKQYRHIAIKSVSQISSLRGSSTYISGTSSAYIAFSLGFTAICIKLNQINDDNNYNDNDYYSLLILLSSLFGTVGAVLFPLDSSILTKFMHYLSAFTIIYGPTISFGLYMQWDLLSIILISLQQIFVITYGIALFCLPNKSNNKNKVHLISLFSIFTELIAVAIAITSKILYVYHM